MVNQREVERQLASVDGNLLSDGVFQQLRRVGMLIYQLLDDCISNKLMSLFYEEFVSLIESRMSMRVALMRQRN